MAPTLACILRARLPGALVGGRCRHGVRHPTQARLPARPLLSKGSNNQSRKAKDSIHVDKKSHHLILIDAAQAAGRQARAFGILASRTQRWVRAATRAGGAGGAQRAGLVAADKVAPGGT